MNFVSSDDFVRGRVVCRLVAETRNSVSVEVVWECQWMGGFRQFTWVSYTALVAAAHSNYVAEEPR